MTVQRLNTDLAERSKDMVSLPSYQEIYRRKYNLLLEQYEAIQQDNERIIHRIQQVRKVTRRYCQDALLLVDRLDKHGDNFRSVIEAIRKDSVCKIKRVQKVKQEKQLAPSSTKKATKRKAKGEKTEKDPNAPKKPCNAFFQFCQEQRPIVMAESSQELGEEPSKQELTRQLASRWRALPVENKQVYVAMFERSKEKYAEEMTAYNIKKEQS